VAACEAHEFLFELPGEVYFHWRKHLDEESKGKPTGFCQLSREPVFKKPCHSLDGWFETIDICNIRIAKKINHGL